MQKNSVEYLKKMKLDWVPNSGPTCFFIFFIHKSWFSTCGRQSIDIIIFLSKKNQEALTLANQLSYSSNVANQKIWGIIMSIFIAITALKKTGDSLKKIWGNDLLNRFSFALFRKYISKCPRRKLNWTFILSFQECFDGLRLLDGLGRLLDGWVDSLMFKFLNSWMFRVLDGWWEG